MRNSIGVKDFVLARMNCYLPGSKLPPRCKFNVHCSLILVDNHPFDCSNHQTESIYIFCLKCHSCDDNKIDSYYQLSEDIFLLDVWWNVAIGNILF